MPTLDRFSNHELSVIVSDLLVATADDADPLLDDTVSEVLKALRTRLGMDVVFVSEFIDGRRMFRFVDHRPGATSIHAGDSNAIEEGYCKRVVDGRLPELIHDAASLPATMELPDVGLRIGGHLSTPIVLRTGQTYGTLCCFSSAPKPELRDKDLDTLRLCAKLVAAKLEMAQRAGLSEPPPDWKLEPVAAYRSPVWALP